MEGFPPFSEVTGDGHAFIMPGAAKRHDGLRENGRLQAAEPFRKNAEKALPPETANEPLPRTGPSLGLRTVPSFFKAVNKMGDGTVETTDDPPPKG